MVIILGRLTMRSRFYSQIILILTILFSSVHGDEWVKTEGGWQPFTMPENPTLKIVSDPHAFATLSQVFTWELEWTPENTVLPGSQIELRSLNLRTYFEWKYTRIDMDKADITTRRPIEVTSDYVFSIGGKWTIARATLLYGLKKGKSLKIRISGVPTRFSSLDDVISIWTADYVPLNGQDEIKPKFEKLERAAAKLHVTAGPIERLGIYAHPMANKQGKVRFVVAPEDRFSNASRFEKETPFQLSWMGKTWTEQIEKPIIFEVDAPEDVARITASVNMSDLSVQDNIANGQRQDKMLVVTSNPVWGTSKMQKLAAFGEFHWHTEISGDGANPLFEGMKIARDHYNLNYCMPSDHSPSPAQWDYTVHVLEDFNKDDAFVTLFGWENSTREGHDNYYFTEPHHPVGSNGESKVRGKKPYEVRDQLSKLHDELDADKKFIAIPHHTNAVAETYRADGTPYWYPYQFTKPDSHHRLIEIFQARGNMERNQYTDAWRGWYSQGSSAQDALALGYKLGFTAGTDSHTGRPVRSNAAIESMGRLPLDCQSVTGVWVDEMNRQSVFNGLHSRHTWACWDTRAIVEFRINDALMGSEINLKKGQPINACLKMSAEDIFQSIEIVSDKVEWIDTADKRDVDLTIDLGSARENTWFYMRALLRNGGIIYASPVFIDVTI